MYTFTRICKGKGSSRKPDRHRKDGSKRDKRREKGVKEGRKGPAKWTQEVYIIRISGDFTSIHYYVDSLRSFCILSVTSLFFVLIPCIHLYITGGYYLKGTV
jgi:hypothetical protein